MAAIDTNKILSLPCDEQSGSTTLYDYSQSRKDGVLNADDDGILPDFTQGNNGNAVDFNGRNYATINSLPLLNINDDFSLFFDYYAKTAAIGSPQKFILLLNYDGVSQWDAKKYITVEIELSTQTWYKIALIREGNRFDFYLNGILQKSITDSRQLLGLSFNQDYYQGGFAFAKEDNIELFNTAFDSADISEYYSSLESSSITYLIDGVDIKDTYGVCVSASKGVVDKPKFKDFANLQWNNYHGEDVDLNHKYFQAREIELSCFIKAESKNDFITKLFAFENLFETKGTQTLQINVITNKPLLYKVYCKDGIAVDKVWNNSLMVGTFTLKLIEPHPVKKVLCHIKTSSSTAQSTITVKTQKYIDIDWGDGHISYDISGTVTLNHTYTNNGQYYIIITGCIDEIESLTSNDIIVWSKL